MLIVGLGEHDMILGYKWFVETSVLVNCKNRCLIWFESAPKPREWGRILTTTKKNLEPAASSQYHQADADRQDQTMAALDATKPRTILR